MVNVFVHPVTKEPLIADEHGCLWCRDNQDVVVVRPSDGCYDFANLYQSGGDRAYYDSHYHHGAADPRSVLGVDRLKKSWEQDTSFKLLRDMVGDVRERRVLLLGNGVSVKELYFVFEGADVFYTDVSLEAVRAVKCQYQVSGLPVSGAGAIQFHAVDALHLPFEDQAFDIIYGCAFVHHIEDLSTLFGEVHRCLKRGGKCIFLDDAYSPVWQCAKATILWPLRTFSQWRSGISPEDKLATQKGGYRVGELQDILKQHGFRHLIYRRTMFFEHLMHRGATKMLSKRLGQAFVPIGRFIDRRVVGPRWVERHGRLLVWGYIK